MTKKKAVAKKKAAPEVQEKQQGPKPWQHPTGGAPKRVAIIGLGPTSQDWHSAHVQYTPPIQPVDEVWTVNKGFRTIKSDMVFVMDDLVQEANISPRYGEDIARLDIPVLTSTVDALVKDRWPNALAYPLEQVLCFYGARINWLRTGETKMDGAKALNLGLSEAGYFSNSIPYMLAYAGMLGVRSISLWGCDYTFPGSAAREDDRANAEYWIAILQHGLGVTFEFPARTTICNRNKGRVFYGFNGRQPY